jgi:hypothetical protein
MTIKTIFLLIFLMLVFFSGIYFCYNQKSMLSESFETKKSKSDSNCPNLLIKSGNAILLFNSNLPESPGVNPIPFYSLDEYINYLESQKRKGIRCPVLFLQEETNTQGETVYRMRPDIFDQQGGLEKVQQVYNTRTPQVYRKPIPVIDANQDNKPWNSGGFHEFDPYGLHIGRYTEIDAIHDSTTLGTKLSDNPMDDNWGGVIFTNDKVASGKYEEREVAPQRPLNGPAPTINDLQSRP